MPFILAIAVASSMAMILMVRNDSVSNIYASFLNRSNNRMDDLIAKWRIEQHEFASKTKVLCDSHDEDEGVGAGTEDKVLCVSANIS